MFFTFTIFDRDIGDHLAYKEQQVEKEKKLVISFLFLRGFARVGSSVW